MNTICSSAREVAAVVEEEEEEAVVEKAEAVVEKAVEAVAPKVALEALAVLEADLPVPTSVAQLVEEADPNHNTEAASTTAAARQLLTAPVPRAL